MRLDRPLPLQLILAIAISLIAIGITTSVTFTLGTASVTRVQREIGLSLATLADQMQDKLDRGVFERLREISNAAAIAADLHQRNPAQLRAWLERLETSFPDFAWIGLVDFDGKVIAATGGMLEGLSVKGEDWFEKGLIEASAGDVHDDARLNAALVARGRQSSRFVDVAAPVMADGKLFGVLGAHLSWRWAQEVSESLFGSNNDRAAEVLVVRQNGTVVLGPEDVEGKSPRLKGLTDDGKVDRFAVETWPDGKAYLTGYAKSDGYRQFTGLGWTVFVRQAVDVAFEPANRLQRQIFIIGLCVLALTPMLSWLLAAQLAQPLLTLARAAEQVRRGNALEMPRVGIYSEAQVLSTSLQTLLSELQRREARLADLNASLEDQVADRTRELAHQNNDLIAAKNEAERANQSKSRFLAAASHDLRQPLHALTLFARALSRRTETPDAAKLVGQMEQALASLKEMFDALLDVSRLDAGLIQPNPRWIVVGDLVERVSAGFQAEASQRGLQFRARSTRAVLRTDAAILEAMLRNLISNAMKFTSEGGLLVTCRRLAGNVVIDVYDTGSGLSPQQLERVFHEFERTRRSATGINDGLGLGLALVKRYAKLLGGQVDVRSTPGKGSRFRITMPEPAQPPDSQPSATPRHSAMSASGGPWRILVLDNEPLIVAALSRDLMDRGHEVAPAESVAEAEEIIMNGPWPDAAVVDVNLTSEESGPEFVARMERRFQRQLPTLVLTGGTDADTLGTLTRSGRRWLTKPAEPEHVATALGEVVTTPRQAHAIEKADRLEDALRS